MTDSTSTPQASVRILIMSSDPRNAKHLRLATERRELEDALRGTRSRAKFSLHDVGSCRTRDITRALDEHRPNILHFSGHADNSGIYFEQDNGEAVAVNKAAFGALLGSQEGLELVVLNSCYSQEQAQAIADAVGHVIGMEGAIHDEDAIVFSRELYRALGDGRTYEEAFERVRVAVGLTSNLKPHLLTRAGYKSVSLRREESNPAYYLPFLSNLKFVGRSVELHKLHHKLFIEKTCRKVAVVGLGGVGKTQLVLQFATSVKHDHPNLSIFWVPALSVETFEQAYQKIAKALNIALDSAENVRTQVQQRLSTKTAGKWLLIVDNADDLDLLQGSEKLEGLLDSLPESDDGLTIFTTRWQAVAQVVAGSDVVEINKLEKLEAIDLLKKSLARDAGHDDNEQIIISLLTELDYLPLAITQAAAYINTNKIRIERYLSLLKSSEQDAIILMSKGFRSDARYKSSENAVAKTWLVSFQQILKHDTVAADLLAFISCIEWKNIPYSLLPAVSPAARMTEAVGTLCSYSFLEEKNDGKSFDMHRLVHLSSRVWLAQVGGQADKIQTALAHITRVFPSDDYQNREQWREYLPHAARIVKEESVQEMPDASELSLEIGRCLYVDGRMKEALVWLQKSCKWRDDHLTKDHPSRLTSQRELAGAYRANGQIKAAIKLLEAVVVIRAGVLAEDHPDRLGSQHALAIAYRANGQVKEAVKLLEAVVAIQAGVLAEDHPDGLASQHALAIAYRANGQVKEAVKLLEAVVVIQAGVLAEDHPDRLTSQHTLAGAYRANGQVKEAVKLLEAVVAIRAEVLVEDHPDRLASQHELAGAYRVNGETNKAVRLFGVVVAIQAKVLAEDHPDRLLSEEALQRCYAEL